MRPAFLLAILVSGAALAAPDEDLLGKAEGYPACKMAGMAASAGGQRCLVDLYSGGFEREMPARRIAKGASTTPLKRAERDVGADAFMAANRNTGLLVLRGDTILAERYNYERKPEARFASMSMAKTLVSMLVGVALHEKLIHSIDDRADEYVPELKGHPYGETKLKDLLTMSSGVKFTEVYDGKDDMAVMVRKTFFQQGPGGVDTVITFRERTWPAGTRFSYASAETQVLGLVLRAATGKPLADYLSEKIWQPMGAEFDATWNTDAGGHEMAFCCINAALRDWARVGMMLANEGRVGERQVIPAEWVREATRVHSPHLQVGTATMNNGYGYQTWLIDRDGRFALLGVRGQAVFVDPKSKLVVVHTAVHASSRDSPARGAQFKYWNSLLSRMEP